MPVGLPAPPEYASAAALGTMHSFARANRFGTERLRGARSEELSLVLPHPIYGLELGALIEERSLRPATLVGWRYLVQRGDEVVASAEVDVDSGNQTARFAQFNEGPYVASTVARIEELSEDPECDEGTFELRLLKVPGIFVVALWLVSEEGAGTRLSVLPPAPPELDARRLLSEEDFIHSVVERAQRNLEFHNARR